MKFNFIYLLLIIRTLTFKKLTNYVRARFSYWFGGVDCNIAASPISLSIEPTNICNLRCPECVTGSGQMSRHGEVMDMMRYERILRELPSSVIHLFLYFQGEPFLNPHFCDMVSSAKSRGLFVATSTNGHFLSEKMCESIVSSGLDHIIVSMDGATEDVYCMYRRGGSLRTVVEGLERLVACKKRRKSLSPLIELQFVVFRHNEEEMKPFAEMAHEIGADKYVYKSAQIYDVNADNPQVQPPESLRYSRYAKHGGVYVLKRTGGMGRCWRQWSSCVVTVDGSVAPCCYDKQAEACYGNVLANGFSGCWKSLRNVGLRKELASGRMPSICEDCPER